MKIPLLILLLCLSFVTTTNAGVTLLDGKQQIGYGGGYEEADADVEVGPFFAPSPDPQGPTDATLDLHDSFSSPDQAGTLSADMSLTSIFSGKNWNIDSSSDISGLFSTSNESSLVIKNAYIGGKTVFSIDFSIDEYTCMTTDWRILMDYETPIELDEFSVNLSLS
ncbi:hypothetical protein ACFL6U_02990 [Planctomycetota bacterium]